MSTLKSLFAAGLLLGGVACATCANAGTLADVTILDRDSGERLPTWHHAGRLYVAGQPGNRYAVELKNRAGGRLLAVLSIDGVNAISGETAATQQSGYVLDDGQRSTILGWRKNLDDVAAFYFTRLPDSYAARTGRPDHVGVIGVALFREHREYRDYTAPPVAREQPTSPWDRPAPAAKAAASGEAARAENGFATARPQATERLGTGHGERLTSTSRYTEFRRATSQPAEIITLYYDSYANLVAQGIIPRRSPAGPRPFPGGFVPDPS